MSRDLMGLLERAGSYIVTLGIELIEVTANWNQGKCTL